MVDRVNKALRKMSAKERKQVLGILEEIQTGRISLLDVKKMQGNEHTYRVRKGAFRVIFHMANRDTIRIIDLERRTDTTYSKF